MKVKLLLTFGRKHICNKSFIYFPTLSLSPSLAFQLIPKVMRATTFGILLYVTSILFQEPLLLVSNKSSENVTGLKLEIYIVHVLNLVPYFDFNLKVPN